MDKLLNATGIFADYFNGFADLVTRNAEAKGFWYEGIDRNKPEMIALMHSELSEALEALRKDPTRPDEHCPEFTNLEIELADCVIRIMDFAAGFDLDVGGAIVAKHNFNVNRPHKHGKSF